MARRPTATAVRPAVEAPAVHTDRRSSTKVIVACKVSVARLELQLCTSRTVTEQTQAGPRDVQQFFKTGEIWIVRGTAYPEGTPPKGFIKRPEEEQGYVLTRGIPKDFWDAWAEQYASLEMVKNRLIYACDTYDEIQGVAGENADVHCAFSPLDMPEKSGDGPPDSRVPAPVQADVSNIDKMAV